MPLYVRTLLMTISLVPLIVFVGVPFVDSILNIFEEQLKEMNTK